MRCNLCFTKNGPFKYDEFHGKRRILCDTHSKMMADLEGISIKPRIIVVKDKKK